MKVAIIGGGISGLSCAFELKKHGIIPKIFEKKSYIGDALDLTIVTLRMFDPFKESPMKYLKKNYKLNIKPLNPLKELIMIGPTNKTIVRGKVGYIFKENGEEDSLEGQIANQVNLSVDFDHYVNIEDIKNDFDYIVCANGDETLAKKLNIWNPTLHTYIRISTVLGDFKVNSITMWNNKEYAKNAYCYLLPYDKDRGTLVFSATNISYEELDFYWNQFLRKENIQYKIIETRDVQKNIGFVYPLQIDNIYFVGDAGGLTDDFLGFGAMRGIESGILAGRCIANHLDYDKSMEPIIKDLKRNHEFRKAFNHFDNKDLDRLIAFLGLPIIKQFIYNNPYYKVSRYAPIVKFYNQLKQKK